MDGWAFGAITLGGCYITVVCIEEGVGAAVLSRRGVARGGGQTSNGLDLRRIGLQNKKSKFVLVCTLVRAIILAIDGSRRGLPRME